MPRTQLHRRVGNLLGVLALAAATLGPLAARADAAPEAQDGPPPPAIVVAIDEPTHRSGVSATRVLVRGWAANPASPRGTGVARVDLYLDGGPDTGGQYLGVTNYGRSRPDVAAALGPQFLSSGWDIVADLPRGPHTLVAVAAPLGGGPSIVLPGVASVRATVGGMAGRTVPGCGAGGYCSSDEGGEWTGTGPGFITAPLYAGNQYVGSGAFGHGQTTPPYGWWDANLPQVATYLLAFAANDPLNQQLFYGTRPNLYNQGLMTQLSTVGGLATTGTCYAPAFLGMDILSLSVYGGYSFGFPFGLGGIRSTLDQAGSFSPGIWNTGQPISVSYAGGVNPYFLGAGGATASFNGSQMTLSRMFGGGVAGPGGIGGAIASNQGNISTLPWVGDTGQVRVCGQPL